LFPNIFFTAEVVEDKEVNKVRNVLDSWISKTEARILKTEKALGEKLEILDTDGDGEINKEEVEKFVHKILKHPNPAAATAFVNMLDKDKDGLISIVEILEYIKERKELLEEEPIEAIDVSRI
jgi:Ca2+-binding EF-hand superfamily protein